jgi:hypothetical protein
LQHLIKGEFHHPALPGGRAPLLSRRGVFGASQVHKCLVGEELYEIPVAYCCPGGEFLEHPRFTNVWLERNYMRFLLPIAVQKGNFL